MERESVCDQCTSAFLSWSALHWHIRTGCVLLQEAIAETSSSLFSAKPILKSTAKLFALGLVLAFRGWKYITISITFNPAALPSLTDLDGSVYLDIGYEVTFVDRDWLIKKLPFQKISSMLVLLKIRYIGASKHKSRDFALTTIYIPCVDKKVREV